MLFFFLLAAKKELIPRIVTFSRAKSVFQDLAPQVESNCGLFRESPNSQPHSHIPGTIRQLTAKRPLSIFKDVPLKTRRALSLYRVYMAIAPF